MHRVFASSSTRPAAHRAGSGHLHAGGVACAVDRRGRRHGGGHLLGASGRAGGGAKGGRRGHHHRPVEVQDLRRRQHGVPQAQVGDRARVGPRRVPVRAPAQVDCAILRALAAPQAQAVVITIVCILIQLRSTLSASMQTDS